MPNTAQNAPIINNLTISGNGTSQEGIGAIRLGGKAVLTASSRWVVRTIGGASGNQANFANTFDSYPAINADGTTLYVDPSHLLSGKITGQFSLDIGSAVSIPTNFKISNPDNDWTGNTNFVNGGGNTVLRLGANEAIPNGVGKGNLVWGPGVSSNTNFARLDLNGFNETVNGLSTTTTNLGGVLIENNGFSATITGDVGFKTYSFTAGTSTLSVGDFNQTATFAGVIPLRHGATVSLPDPNGGTTPTVFTAPWVTAGLRWR